jgi:hypothetical protein
MAATTKPNTRHSIIDKITPGLKKTRCTYKKENADNSIPAFKNKGPLPVDAFLFSSK